MATLTDEEFLRLKQGITVALSFPLIDDLEDYVWEAVFAYMKNLPSAYIRDKQLFDIVNPAIGTGWSAKSLQWSIYPSCEFELVIQRADIFKKSIALGFETPLTLANDPQTLGYALLKHWQSKVELDSLNQSVHHRKVCILLKSRNRQRFAYYEEDLRLYEPDSLTWRWTDASKTGLQGLRQTDGFCVYRWYPNQKQLFERFILPPDTDIFELNIRRLAMDEVMIPLLNLLNRP